MNDKRPCKIDILKFFQPTFGNQKWAFCATAYTQSTFIAKLLQFLKIIY
jgi:hypothetical protein